METKNFLRMKEGDGEFSYAQNSTLQGRILDQVSKPLIKYAIRSLLSNDNNTHFLEIFNVADLGCGVGSSPISFISYVIDTINEIYKDLKLDNSQVPKINMWMNDLPSNDFKLLFQNLKKLEESKGDDCITSCLFMGVYGSFYNRLFPQNFLHLVHSNYALHWLSRVPPSIYNESRRSKNNGKMIVCETSPREVVKAYRAQFHKDFSQFLECRSCEIVSNGYMVLTIVGSPSMVPHHPCSARLLCKVMDNLVSKRLIKEEKAKSFDLPLHYPSKEEIESTIKKEGSFTIEKLETLYDCFAKEINDIEAKAISSANSIRASIEVLVCYHFGEHICDLFFDELVRVTIQHFYNEPNASVELFNIVVMLRRKID
ncbi:probable jasmonic acid carboxyl methyltransferase 1 [Amaranthus tricolor]|uniref:probable jasmonic acid carboxyl methyltransferase 1 n=1 Tax=Amaranthus tricolor TaxID=29722 RepID=UPI00258C6637|nr:probable jasmonic acid carboxyl methyltransferase 1 [Amaranthus tricolor]